MRVKSLAIACFVVLLLYVSVFAQSVITGTVLSNANLRTGPGTTYAVDGSLKAGASVTIVGQNDDKTWYQLKDGHWIFASLVRAATVTSTSNAKKQTPASSSATPTVTKTGIVTPTPVVKLNRDDPAVKAYGQSLTKALGLFSEGSKIVGVRFTEASGDLTVMLTDEWKVDVAAGLVDLQLCSEAVRKLNPPAALVSVHGDLLKMADHLDNVIVLLPKAIDKLDSTGFTKGLKEYQLAVSFVDSANQKLSALIAASSADATSTPLAATTSTPKPTTTYDPKWYAGGTLHKATVAQWRVADQRNKLATVADWTYAGFKDADFSSPDKLRPYADKMLMCIDGMVDMSQKPNSPVVELAAFCATYMATPEP